ncbi:MAG: DUF177 domain-containing protein [Oscillospiraceae bacterium]|jgi:uncharacterized protein|nr:DUF177 domain-containing protein [Oscillospiraceae bacterium]
MNLEAVFANPGAALPVNADFSFAEEDTLFPETVHTAGEVRNRSGVVTLHTTFSAHISFDCDRCAEPAVREYTGEILQTLVTQLNGEEDSSFTVLPDSQLDLRETVREELYLQLPSKLLCTPNCRGLCPGCGANLNNAVCTCIKQIDPRLAALLSLPEDIEETP